MEKNENLILTSDNFFDSVEFQKRSDKEQVSYILFYVTEVARLRKDMIPDIIADRIQDQYESFFQRNPGADKASYRPLKADQIKKILEKDSEWFQKVNSGVFSGSDRDPNMKKNPYILTQYRRDELWKQFDKDIKSKISLQSKRLFMDRTISSILSISVLLVAFTIFFAKVFSGGDEIVATSVKEYVHRINFEDYNPTKKSVLFVYYVTKITEMRDEVNISAIHDRIIDLDYEMPSIDELSMLLDNSELLMSNNGSPKAYHLSNLGIDYAEDIVNSHVNKPKGINISWELFYTIVAALVSLMAFLVKTAYSFGKQ